MIEKFRIVCVICCLASSFTLKAQERGAVDQKAQAGSAGDINSPNHEANEDINLLETEISNTSPKASRLTLSHELSSRTQETPRIVYNRSFVRVEYSEFFLGSYVVQLDSKLNLFWRNDHRAKAEEKTTLFEANTPEAFLQYSGAGGNTSIKVGVQRLIWGESAVGIITDEVSPRNFSELLFIPLEESRIGQFMLNLDHFSSSGDWSLFYIPYPKFNKYPKSGTAYYLAPFNDQADIRDEPFEKNLYEYGTRWRKTFGKSDVSFMAASLIDNDYVFRMDGVTAAGRLSISRRKQRFTLTGVTFNYAKGKYLLKGEVGIKSPKSFNDASFQVLEKDVVDGSLGLTYSLGQSDTIGLEVANSHVGNWDSSIVGVTRNTSSLMLNTNLFFFNDMLSVNWLTIYGWPFTSYQSSVRTSYKWNDNTTFSVDAHIIDVPDRNGSLRPYRNQDQIVFRIQYQF